uniref:Amidohydrolase n=2 Tax=Onchocerca ochengi TaxID=42157 RepID=A0A182F040_ONCOC
MTLPWNFYHPVPGPNSTAKDQIIIKNGARLIDATPSRIPDTQ